METIQKIEKNGFKAEIKKVVAYPLLGQKESNHVYINGVHEASYRDLDMAISHASKAYVSSFGFVIKTK